LPYEITSQQAFIQNYWKELVQKLFDFYGDSQNGYLVVAGGRVDLQAPDAGGVKDEGVRLSDLKNFGKINFR
jgi:predicted RNase H-like nuclease